MHIQPMQNRFAVRPDPRGFSVFDLTTGETLIIAASRQSGLSLKDAEHTASLFNQAPAAPSATTH